MKKLYYRYWDAVMSLPGPMRVSPVELEKLVEAFPEEPLPFLVSST